MKASVLGIGTELTEGQIANKNGAWISARLKERGFITSAHLVVPDDRPLILEALDFCARQSDCLFLTGGLGPTSDDFTRDVVAAWAGLPLEFDEGSWRHVEERLKGRGFAVREIQKQQCYFPLGAQVITNTQGTANAFTFEARGKKIFVLPGPPREIEAVWAEGIAPWLEGQAAHHDPYLTRKWDTLGRGESDIALLAEEALAGVAIEKGYRVHLPYVEVKVSYFKSQEASFAEPIQNLERALAPFTATRDGEDAAASLAALLRQAGAFHLVDEVSGGFLLGRLSPFLREFEKNRWSFSTSASTDGPSSPPLCLQLLGQDELSARILIQTPLDRYEQTVTAPYASANMADRRRQYFAERALLLWKDRLSIF